MAAWCLYGLNRLVVKPHTPPSGFWHAHFNDLLLVPALLPVVLWLFRRIGVRHHDQPPTLAEVTLHTLGWCAFFEAAGPALLHRGVADPWDALCYAAGAFVSVLLWRHLRETAPVRTPVPPASRG